MVKIYRWMKIVYWPDLWGFQTTVPSLPSLPSVSSSPPWSSGTEVTLDSPQTPTTDTHTARELTTRDTTHQASRPAMESSPVSSKITLSLSFSLSLSLLTPCFFHRFIPCYQIVFGLWGQCRRSSRFFKVCWQIVLDPGSKHTNNFLWGCQIWSPRKALETGFDCSGHFD